ncbi:MAG: PAS domain S-box protein [Nitrospirae bacterium]|nr:MAG: PAS domain S-box protein [Nitrospirota bacterium]
MTKNRNTALTTSGKLLEKRTAELKTATRKLAQEIKDKKRVEEELKEHRDFLDQIVKERTAELRKVNKELRAEIMRRIQMEKELVESQRFVNRITDATPNLLYIYDVITNRNIYVNPRITHILGYSFEQIRNMGSSLFQAVLHPDDAGVFQSLKQNLALVREKDIIEKEYRMKNVQGEWRWFSSRIVIFRKTASGQPHLILGVAQDITERRKTEEELNSSREQLRGLLAHHQSVREEERTRISREIHDELGQSLTALKIDLSWLMKRLNRQQSLLREKARGMSALIDLNIQTVKRIAAELRPGLLDDLGLTAALEWQAEEFQERSGIACQLLIEPEDLDIGRDISTAVFRIFQETLTNVVRHAKASRVRVTLTKRPAELILNVSDNGKGITRHQAMSPASIGLTGMKERVNFLGGTLSINGIRHKGTTVRVLIPLPLNAGGPAESRE